MKSSDLRLLLSRSGGRRLFVASIAAAGTWSIVVLVNAFLIAELIIRITRHQDGTTRFLILVALLWLFRALFQSSFEKWCTLQALEMKRSLRGEVSSQASSYSTVSAAQLSTILTKGLNALDIYVGRFIPQMLSASIVPPVVIAFLFYKDTLSGLIALITLPLIPLFGALIGRYSADSVARKWKTLGTLSRYFEDSLRGFATLKIFGRNATQGKRIAAMGDRYTQETMQVLRVSFLSAFALELIATLSVAIIAVSVGLRLVGGSIDFKSALVILILAPDVYFPVRNAASLFHASEDGTHALKEIGKFTIEEDSSSSEMNQKSFGESPTSISWSDWDFRREGGDVIKFPSGRIEKGEMVFLVGESGLGKTTFSQHLLGTRFGAEVQLHLGGTEVSLDSSNSSAWQRKLGWIPQNPQLASGNIRDQFRLIISTISDEEIVNALHGAGLELSELPAGLETPIGRGGEQGHSASGGQIRRIALARALIRKPDLIIADEPTADLDAVSAKRIMGALRKVQAEGAMVFCITHDSQVAQGKDRVLLTERAKS